MVRIETIADVGIFFLPQRPFINFRRNAFLLRTLNYLNISQGVIHSAKTAKRQGRLFGTWTYFLISSLWLLRNKVTIWLLLFIISSRDEETPLLGKRINKLSPITCGYGFLSRFLSWIHFFLEYRIIFIAALTFILYQSESSRRKNTIELTLIYNRDPLPPKVKSSFPFTKTNSHFFSSRSHSTSI